MEITLRTDGRTYPGIYTMGISPLEISCNQEHMELVCEELESGKYAQGKGVLKGTEGYCCLGVASEISGTGVWTKNNASFGSNSYYTFDDGVLSDSKRLTQRVADWLGLEVSFGRDDDTYELFSLPLFHENLSGRLVTAITLNDTFGCDFKEIARVFRIFFLHETDLLNSVTRENKENT